MDGRKRKKKGNEKEGQDEDRQAATILPTAHVVFLTLQVFLDTANPIPTFPWISPPLAIRLGIETVQDLGSGHLPSLAQRGQQDLPSYQWAPRFLHGVGCLRRPNELCICTNGWRWCWSLSAGRVYRSVAPSPQGYFRPRALACLPSLPPEAEEGL